MISCYMKTLGALKVMLVYVPFCVIFFLTVHLHHTYKVVS